MLESVESNGRGRRGRLKHWGIPRSTYYFWKKKYASSGTKGLERKPRKASRPAWNSFIVEELETMIAYALRYPELSSRLLAVKISDEEDFTVSESTMYRLLKSRGLVRPRPLDQNPAGKQWRHRTTGPDDIWQADAIHFRVMGWGYYKGIPVMDDFSRKVLALPLKLDETSYSIADAVQEALEKAREEGHTIESKPTLLSDNGAGFRGEVLGKYLKGVGMRQIHGAPYHPQTQGKVERFNRKLRETVCLVVYCTPWELEAALARAAEKHNETPHEALKNVCPNDVYAGRQQEILARRAEKKRITMLKRKLRSRSGMA